MKIEFDAWEAQTLHEMMRHYVHLMTVTGGDKAVVDIAFDYMGRLESFMSDVSEETEQRKYDHIEYTNWAE